MIHQCHRRQPLRPNSVTGTKPPVDNRPSRPASVATLPEICEVRDNPGFILISARISSMAAPWPPQVASPHRWYSQGPPQVALPHLLGQPRRAAALHAPCAVSASPFVPLENQAAIPFY